MPALLLLAVALVYWPVLRAGFVPWDDRIYTEDNPLVRGGLSPSAVWRAFNSSWENNWSPVFWIFLAAQVSVAGGVHPGVFHATSLALCLVNAGLLWFLLRQFGLSEAAALLAAALFSLHPLGVESAAWISAQKHLLAITALLSSLICLRLARTSLVWMTASVAAFGVSLMCSQIGVGLPVFVFVWEFLNPARTGGSRWFAAFARSAPYGVLALAAAAVTMYVNWNPGAQVVPWFSVSWGHRLTQAVASLGWQALSLLWPFHLAPAYPWPSGNLAFFMVLGAGAILFLAWLVTWRVRLVTAGVAGFLACFLPVSGLLAVPIVFTADRLVSLPGVFLVLSLGALLDGGLARFRLLPVAAGIVAVGFGVLTFQQTRLWRDEKTILAHTLACYPDSISAQINQAVLLGREGDLEGALAIFRRVRQSDPALVGVWRNEVAVLDQLHRKDEAAAVAAEAVAAIPASPDLHLQYGLLLEESGKEAEALARLKQARELDPMSVQTTFQYSRALTRYGRAREALPLLELLEFTMQRQPAYWDIRAIACEQSGDVAEAARARGLAEQLRK